MVNGFQAPPSISSMNMDDFSSYESIPANNKNRVITTNGGKPLLREKAPCLYNTMWKENGRTPEQANHVLSSHLFYLRTIFSIDVHGRVFTLRAQGLRILLNLLSSSKSVTHQFMQWSTSIQRRDTIYWVKNPDLFCLPRQMSMTIHVTGPMTSGTSN